MRVKYHVGNIIAAALTLTVLVALPFVNPCEAEDSTACTWDATVQGNETGMSFTDFYGITIYRP